MATAHSAPLFDNESERDYSLVEVLAQRKPADKAQRRFHQLVAKIEHKRNELKAWQAYLDRYNQRIASELEPLRSQLRAEQRQMTGV